MSICKSMGPRMTQVDLTVKGEAGKDGVVGDSNGRGPDFWDEPFDRHTGDLGRPGDKEGGSRSVVKGEGHTSDSGVGKPGKWRQTNSS